jgi:hypothetical protein
MRGLQKTALAGLLALYFVAPAWAQQQAKPIANPQGFAEDVIGKLSQGKTEDVTNTIVEALGQPSQINNLKNALQIFDGKHFDSSKVIDHQFGESLRQIVYYAPVESLGFLYFRFNLKKTSQGWVLTHFAFKSESQELFPKDFVDRY